MARADHLPDFKFSWITLSHYSHPYGDILWHLFWGVVVGVSIVFAVIAKDFLFLIISFLALIFFFHPIFYEPSELRIKIEKSGVGLNEKFYPWDNFNGFEIFHNGERDIIFFIPKHHFHSNLDLPLEDYIDVNELRSTLRQFLNEYVNAISVFDHFYRRIFK